MRLELYTTATLSRELMAKGIDQQEGCEQWRHNPCATGLYFGPYAASGYARALRLDEVLEEIDKRVRPTEAIILGRSRDQSEAPWFCEIDHETPGMGFSREGETPIQAAGRCLLALLHRESAEK